MAVSLDLRQRAINAYERGEGPIPSIAARFSVGASSLARWIKRKRATGSPERLPRAGGKPRRITAEGERLLRHWLQQNPSVAQHELAARLFEATGHAVVQQTVGRTLSRMRLTRKKNDAPDPADHP